MAQMMDRAEGMDEMDRGGAGWMDAGRIERFCDELAETRLMVARASLRLAARWPGHPPRCASGCLPDSPTDDAQGNAHPAPGLTLRVAPLDDDALAKLADGRRAV